MPDTFEGLAVVLVALLPGALFMWSFERLAGRWGIGFSDRLLRFLGISVLLHALVAPATYNIWHDYLRSGALTSKEELPLWLWPTALAYAIVPIALGTGLALGLARGVRWIHALRIAPLPPTAWDAIFSVQPEGWVLMRLKSGRWVGGHYTEGSYAGGYPEPPDIFVSIECAVDQEEEEFIIGPNNEPQPMGLEKGRWGLLVRWDEVEYLEVTPT